MKYTGKFVIVIVFLAVATLCLFASNSLAAGSRTVVVTGSTTVLPIAQRAAEVFMSKNTDASISVRGGGSGVGISALIEGTCDIADSSRPIKDKELDQAVANKKDPTAHVIAMDGIAVIVNPSNQISKLTKNQVKDIYTGRISNWSELGGGSEKIVVVSRDSSSGTFESFGELALDKEKVRADALMQASNQAVASTVSKTPGAIGYVGLGFMGTSVKAVELNGVACSKDTVLSKEYLLSRPLFMYTNGKPQGTVKDFIDFVASKDGQALVEEVGYVSLK